MALWGASDADEAKPKWLTTAEKKTVYATTAGWVHEAHNADMGNDNTSAQVEVLACVGALTTSLGAADITSCEFITTSWMQVTVEHFNVEFDGTKQLML